MDRQGLNDFKVSINDNPGLTLTYMYFAGRSNLDKLAYCANTRSRCQLNVNRTIGFLWCFFFQMGNSGMEDNSRQIKNNVKSISANNVNCKDC